MGRMYIGGFAGSSVSAIQDIWEINVPSDALVILHAMTLVQQTSFGDAAEEVLRLEIKRGVGSTSGSGGSGSVPSFPIQTGSSSFGGTLEHSNTTQASGGTITTLAKIGWNIRMPFHHIFIPKERPIFSPSQMLLFSLESTPSVTLTMAGTILFEEVGG